MADDEDTPEDSDITQNFNAPVENVAGRDININIDGVDPKDHAKVLAENNDLRKERDKLLDDAKVSASATEYPTWLADPTPEQMRSAVAALHITDKLIDTGELLTPWEQTRIARAAYLAGNGHLDEIEAIYRNNLRYAKSEGNKEAIADARGNLGYIYSLRGELEEAKNHYSQSLELGIEIGDLKGQAVTLSNLANLASLMEKYEEAEVFHQRCIEISKECSDRQLEAITYGNMGNIAKLIDNFDDAIHYHNKSLEIKREIGDLRGEAASCSFLGDVYLSLEDYVGAEKHFRNYVRISREIGAPLYDDFEKFGFIDHEEQWSNFPPSDWTTEVGGG